ncbi:hypothetical protein V2J09_014395 [Rumex salicifolius]
MYGEFTDGLIKHTTVSYASTMINGNRAEAEELHHQGDPNRVMEHIDLLQKDNLTGDPSLGIVNCSYSRSDPSLADGYTYHSKSWSRLGQHVPRTMPSKYQNQFITNYRIKEGLILVAALIVATFAYRFKVFMYLI